MYALSVPLDCGEQASALLFSGIHAKKQLVRFPLLLRVLSLSYLNDIDLQSTMDMAPLVRTFVASILLEYLPAGTWTFYADSYIGCQGVAYEVE